MCTGTAALSVHYYGGAHGATIMGATLTITGLFWTMSLFISLSFGSVAPESLGPLPVESDGGSMAGNADMIRRSRHAVGASSLHFGRAREKKRAGFQSKFSDSTARLVPNSKLLKYGRAQWRPSPNHHDAATASAPTRPGTVTRTGTEPEGMPGPAWPPEPAGTRRGTQLEVDAALTDPRPRPPGAYRRRRDRRRAASCQ